MSKITPTPKAARPRAGKSKSCKLAKLWLATKASTHPDKAWEEFINALVNYMKGWRQSSDEISGSYSVVDDIRQEATILLEQGYMAGNRTLVDATASGSLAAIEQGILHAIRGALVIARKRVQCRGIRQRQIEERLAQQVETNPSEERTNRAKVDERPRIALDALKLALEDERIAPRDAEIIRTRIVESVTQVEIAERSGVSRQAIHQRESRTVKVLRRIVREMEGETLQ